MGISSNSILALFDAKPSRRDAFWAKVDGAWERDPDECWPWTGAFSRCGYGNMRLGDLFVLPHRVSFILVRGFLCEHKKLLHDCDNPKCCNPYHGEPGTHAENMQDGYRKGRVIPGKQKIPPEVYPEIAKLHYEGGIGRRLLAERYGVNPRTIGRILEAGGESGNAGRSEPQG